MNHTFQDAEGRTYRIVLTCRTVIECGRVLGIKILDLFDGESEESQRLDPFDRFEALEFVLGSELRRLGVSRSELEQAMAKAPQIATAWQAFYGAVRRFLPANKQKAVRATKSETGSYRSLHDAAVSSIWEYAGWCGVEPWEYTLAELQEQARHAASREGRSAAVRAGGTPENVRELKDLSLEERAAMFRRS